MSLIFGFKKHKKLSRAKKIVWQKKKRIEIKKTVMDTWRVGFGSRALLSELFSSKNLRRCFI